MDPERLFLRRYNQIAVLAQSMDEGDLIDLAARLYQMLLDQQTLIDRANKNRLKLRFEIVDARPLTSVIPPELLIVAIENTIDPARAPHMPTKVVTRDDLLSLKIVHLPGKDLSLKDFIRHARNVAGGMHSTPEDNLYGEDALIEQIRYNPSMLGLPVGLLQLKSLSAVLLKGLNPLRVDVERRLGITDDSPTSLGEL